MTFHPAPRSCH